jgi:hypothetical protein
MNKHMNAAAAPKTLEPQVFLSLGTPSLAYVRPVLVNGAAAWGIFAADGTGLGVVASRDLAFAAARQHDLDPVAVH